MNGNLASRLSTVAGIALLLIGCSTSSPSADPSTGPSPLASELASESTPGAVVENLTGGRYLFWPFEGVTIAATGPDGWRGYPSWAMDGPLPVRADSTAWATQLRLLESSLMGRLAEEVGEGTVAELRVVGPGAPSWSRGRHRVQDGRGPRDTYG